MDDLLRQIVGYARGAWAYRWWGLAVAWLVGIIGAITVYVLPDTDDNLEDFQWLANEIVADGGDATICAATMLSGVSDRELAAHFPGLATDHAIGVGDPHAPPRGATWVTREGVFVDRIASAWLIRRFIDAEARFKFVPARGYRKQAGELRFDMYQGEFTHAGDRCTFETLLSHFALKDRRLREIAEIIHDIDCKDEKFGRDEAAGIAAVLHGITRASTRDDDRLERGARVFDDLYGK